MLRPISLFNIVFIDNGDIAANTCVFIENRPFNRGAFTDTQRNAAVAAKLLTF